MTVPTYEDDVVYWRVRAESLEKKVKIQAEQYKELSDFYHRVLLKLQESKIQNELYKKLIDN